MASFISESRRKLLQKIEDDKLSNPKKANEQQSLSTLLHEIEDFSIKLDNTDSSKSSENTSSSVSRSRNEMSDRRERKDSESRRSRSKDRHHDDKSRSGSRHRSKSRHRERDKSRSRKDRDGERSRTLDRYERERSRMERDRDRDREKSRTIERDRSRTIDRERDRRDRERDRDRDRDRSRTLDRERHHKERSHHTRKMSSPADISILKNKNTNPNDFLGPSPLNMTSNAENVSAIKGYSHAIATFPRNSSLSNIKTDQMTKIDNKVPFSPGVNGLDTSFTFPRRKEDPFPASASPISAGPLRPGEAESNSSAESSTTAVIQENKPIFPVRQESKGITRTGRSRANTQTSETKKDGSMSISEMKSALMKEPKKLGGPVSLLAALKVGDGLHMYKSSDTINPSFHIQRDITVMKDLLENALTVSTNCYILNKDTANTLKEKIKKYSDQISSIKTKIQSESSIQESVINIVKNGSKDSQTQKSAKEKLSSTNRKLDKLAADLFKVNDKLRISQNDFFSHVIGVYNWELERMKQTGDNFSVSDDDMIKKLKDELEENVCIVKEQQDELDASKALILQLQAQLELKKQDANDSMSTLDRKHVDDIRQQIKELEKQRKEIQTLESKFNESTVSPTNSWTGSLGRNRNLKRMRELEDEITELRDQALEQNDTIDKLKAENSDLKAQLVSIEIIYQSLPSSLSSSRHFTVEDLEKTIKLLLEDNEEQFKRIKSLTKKLRDTEADNEMQQKRMNNLQSLQSPISPRTTSLKKSNNNNNDKDDTDTQLINEVCNLKKELFDQNNEISRLERDLKVAQGDLNESKEREEKAKRDVEDQKIKIETLKNHISELERENKKMQRSGSDDRQDRQEYKNVSSEELNNLRDENKSLKQKIKDITSEQSLLSRDASKNNLELGEYKSKYNKVQEEYDQLNNRYESLQHELEDVKYELESEEAKSKKLRETNNTLQEKYDTLLIEKQQQERGNKFDKKKQNDQLAEAENKVLSVKHELNRVQEELNDKISALRKADDYEKKLLQELEDVKMDYRYLKDEHTNMSDAHTKLLDEQVSMKRELEAMRNERDDFEDNCKRRYKKEIHDLELALQDAEDEIEQQKERCREYQAKYDESQGVRDELDRLKQNLASTKNLMNDTLSNKDKEVDLAIKKVRDAESKSKDAQLKVENMEKLVEDMQNQLTRSENALVDFKSKTFEEREQFQEKIENLSEKLKESEEKGRQLERDLKESRKKENEQEDELKNANKEIDRILGQHEKDMKSLTDSYQGMIDDLEEKLSEAESLRDKLDDLDFKYQNECEKWNRSKRDYEKEILDLTDEQTRTKKQLDDLHEQLIEARQRDTGATFDEVQSLKDREQTLTEELKKKEEREVKLEAELEATLKEFERLTMNIADFEGEKMKMNKLDKEQKEEIEDLRKKLQEATVDNLGSKVAANAPARTKEQAMRNEFRKMIQEVREDYQNQLKRESERNNELDQTIKQMKREKDMKAYNTCNIGTQTSIF